MEITTLPMNDSSDRGSRRTMSPTPIMLSRSDVFTSILAAGSGLECTLTKTVLGVAVFGLVSPPLSFGTVIPMGPVLLAHKEAAKLLVGGKMAEESLHHRLLAVMEIKALPNGAAAGHGAVPRSRPGQTGQRFRERGRVQAAAWESDLESRAFNIAPGRGSHPNLSTLNGALDGLESEGSAGRRERLERRHWASPASPNHLEEFFMSNQRQQKPTLTGQRFKTRKRDEKERFDPSQFQESIVQGLNQTGTDLDAVAKFLDASGAKLDYRRYAETLFDILVAGGMLDIICNHTLSQSYQN
ncbi:hypothetical protein INR49_025194 [Caranx melampygus]|nr:hypothetical protein INR49_025194 [Caranx melampygus]